MLTAALMCGCKETGDSEIMFSIGGVVCYCASVKVKNKNRKRLHLGRCARIGRHRGGATLGFENRATELM